MKRSEFYRHAFVNLGAAGVVRRAYSKAIRGEPLFKLTSKYLLEPVYARRDTTDLLVFDTIFVDREYRCLDNISGIQTIVDAGANCGYSAAYLLSQYPGSRVACIEPDLSNFELMHKNLAPFGDRVTYFKGALWSEVTQLEFDEDSMSENNQWGRRTVAAKSGSGLIDAIDIPALMARQGWDTIDLLKVDIEGAEVAVFADAPWLDKVRHIVIELHNPECREIFGKAIEGRGYEISTCGELTVCLTR